MIRPDPDIALGLALLQGQAWVDDAVARRVATGAEAAVEAVMVAVGRTDPGLLAQDDSDFLATLEACAEAPP